jgi:hypothetical protein
METHLLLLSLSSGGVACDQGAYLVVLGICQWRIQRGVRTCFLLRFSGEDMRNGAKETSSGQPR